MVVFIDNLYVGGHSDRGTLSPSTPGDTIIHNTCISMRMFKYHMYILHLHILCYARFHLNTYYVHDNNILYYTSQNISQLLYITIIK